MKWKKRGLETSISEVYQRNIGASLEEVNGWYKKSYSDSYRIDKLDDAVRLALAFKEKRVTIVGDYDADGITSTSILLLALRWSGFVDVHYRIPKRFSEGYGISNSIIDEIPNGLVITCDNGIAQIEQIRAAKDKGLSVIILDHHLPVYNNDGNAVIPPADVVIDPNAITGSADFCGYCGAGLCYRFAKCMLAANGHKDWSRYLIGLAAIGTVADVMLLKEENTVFTRNGLETLRNPSLNTPGTYALVAGLNLTKQLTARDISFSIGPTVNSSSRMRDDGANDAVELLTFCGDRNIAINMASKLIETNNKRKLLMKDSQEKVENAIRDNCLYSDVPIVVYVPDLHEGIVGIVAGHIAEKYKSPTIVLTDTKEDGLLRGSGRSYGNYNMKMELDHINDLLVKYGGHTGAAGLSVKKEMVDEVRNALISNTSGYEFVESDVFYYDLEINAEEIPDTLKELKKYEPFGTGNLPPVFLIRDFNVIPKNGKYIATVDERTTLSSSTVTATSYAYENRLKPNEVVTLVDLIGTIRDSYYLGNVSIQISFDDLAIKQGSPIIKTNLASKLESLALSH